MSHTAHQTEDELTEYFDPPDVLAAKAQQIVAWIRESKHTVLFTGAGISTSAGISDFRGPTGVWTLRAKGQEPRAGTSTISAYPTTCHMSLVELQRRGLVKYLISQNTDGLHRRSGFPTEALSELHGNSNIERCAKCHKEYLRDARVRTARHVKEHATGRTCDNAACGGALQDTIVNFGENLPRKPLARAEEHSEAADLFVVLGSSLRVSPANGMPETAADRGARLVICNLQRTPLDKRARCRVWARCDDLMRLVMAELQIDVPDFVLRRRVLLSARAAPSTTSTTSPAGGARATAKAVEVSVAGLDADGTPFEFLRSLELRGTDGGTGTGTASPLTKTLQTRDRPPFVFRGVTVPAGRALSLTLHFRGHYDEPALEGLPVPALGATQALLLEFDPVHTHQWTVSSWDTEYAALTGGSKAKTASTSVPALVDALRRTSIATDA